MANNEFVVQQKEVFLMSTDKYIPEAFQKIISTFKHKNINCFFAANSKKALETSLRLIPNNAIAAMGNSLTLRETGIFEALVKEDYQLINQFEAGISREENLRRRKLGLSANVYLSGSNAVTEDGKLLNVDGKGNRVSAMMFGPDKVIIVAGKNKIVSNEQQGWEHIRNYTAPNLAKKLGRNTPCVKTGKCSDCRSPERICRYYTVIGSQMPADKERINLIIVNENLGI